MQDIEDKIYNKVSKCGRGTVFASWKERLLLDRWWHVIHFVTAMKIEKDDLMASL